MSITFSLEDQSKGEISVEVQNNKYILHYPCSDPSECTPYIAKLSPAHYLFELWGAQGGLNGAKGGYSRGKLHLTRPTTTFYIYIGAKGPSIKRQEGDSNPAYNGGGSSHSYDSERSAGSGGGATDIRVDGQSLNHRIIVAGGGGGSNFYNNTLFYGGSGGGEKGIEGISFYDSIAEGGNQTSPGFAKSLETDEIFEENSGVFGYGGNSTLKHTGSGGGGGWYGGAGSPISHVGGGGGSGYILTSKSHRPIDYQHNESIQYYFYSAQTLDGLQQFDNCSDSNFDNGNGCIRITVLSFITCKYQTTFSNHFILFYVSIMIK